jgi:Cu/Ag efflux protein CusF
MNKTQSLRRGLAFATVLFVLAAAAYGQQATKSAKKEFVLKGTVVKVDTNATTVVVNNEYLPGWRDSFTGTYTVSDSEVLRTLEPGDHVTAKVYEGDFKALYDLRLVPPEDLPLRTSPLKPLPR